MFNLILQSALLEKGDEVVVILAGIAERASDLRDGEGRRRRPVAVTVEREVDGIVVARTKEVLLVHAAILLA